MRKKQKSVKKYMKMKEPELANVIFEFLTLFLINIQIFSFQLNLHPFPKTLEDRSLKNIFVTPRKKFEM